MKIKIKGLTHKMKNRVANHGEWWEVKVRELGSWSIEPVAQKKLEEPYGCWATPNKDFQILEEIHETV